MIDKYKNFDGEGFFRALESTMLARDKNWKQVSSETSVSASTLTRMAQGKLPDAPSLAALAAWSGINPADFITSKLRTTRAETLAEITRALRSDDNLSDDEARAMDEIIRAAYKRFAGRKSK